MEHGEIVTTVPDVRDATAHARSLGDGDLVHFLKYIRRRLAAARDAQESAYIEALATLELEATRRGIELRGAPEPLAPRVARRRLDAAIEAGDHHGVEELLPMLDGPGYWSAYRFALGLADPADQARLLEGIRWHLDVRVHGVEAATQRQRKIARALRKVAPRNRVDRLKGLLSYAFKRHFGLWEGKRG